MLGGEIGRVNTMGKKMDEKKPPVSQGLGVLTYSFFSDNTS